MRAHRSWPKLRRQSAFTFLMVTLPRFILAEPRRMRMGCWAEPFSDLVIVEEPAASAPPCKTVGCIGGWTELLVGGRRYADEILGLTDRQAGVLMYGRLCYAKGQGTKEHAKKVVAHMRAFAKAHEQQLRGTMITPTPSRRAA